MFETFSRSTLNKYFTFLVEEYPLVDIHTFYTGDEDDIVYEGTHKYLGTEVSFSVYDDGSSNYLDVVSIDEEYFPKRFDTLSFLDDPDNEMLAETEMCFPGTCDHLRCIREY